MTKEQYSYRRGLSEYRFNQLWCHAYYNCEYAVSNEISHSNHEYDVGKHYISIEDYIDNLTDTQIEHLFIMKDLDIL